MTGVKAKLKIVLQADETVVAESEDGVLWQRVLQAINKDPSDGKGDALGPIKEAKGSKLREDAGQDGELGDPSDGSTAGSDDISKFARFLGTTREIVVGACSPSKTAPYLTLDMHCWNAMKEQTPARGIGSVSPMAVAATLLALWSQQAKVAPATQAEAQRVLATINLRDANAARSIQKSEWLQSRSAGMVVVNPARIKRAIAVAKAFCTQDWTSDLTWKGSSAE